MQTSNMVYQPIPARPATQIALAGGFGSSSAKSKQKKKKGKVKGGSAKKVQNLLTPEGRMEHIKNRIRASNVS